MKIDRTILSKVTEVKNMKKLMLTLLYLSLIASSNLANAEFFMVGDNDGYGYGSAVVPDGAVLPYTPVPPNLYNWQFDNRSPGELAATDGSQNTDFEPGSRRDFTFTINVGQPAASAVFTLDVSGIQTGAGGASHIYLDGLDYSSFLPTEQGAWGSGVFSTNVDPTLLADGSIAVHFLGGDRSTEGPFPTDNIAFDYFSLQTTPVPEPATMLLLGSGLVGLAGYGRKKFFKK